MSRLINADALWMDIIHSMDYCDDILEIIERQPTIEERKAGRWEMVPDPYGFFEEIPVCSECGRTTDMRKTYKFCPNCGADMREREGAQDG